ncbi:MAG: hypothetical protein HZB23_10720 [Deltaproteobacteria bacterium]|nr:hypothetical protein [Deltaproteobacteria bacterium]
MHGAAAVQRMLDALNEVGVSEAYCPLRKAYQYLDEAALDFCRRTRILTSSVSITTVAGRQTYPLPPDYIEPYERTMGNRRLFARYETAGGDVSWPVLTSYEKIRLADRTEAEETPVAFTIRSRSEAPTPRTGSAKVSGAVANGECTLVLNSADFAPLLHPRDFVANTTDGSKGVVLDVLSDEDANETYLVTALFGGAVNQWAANDAAVLMPAATHELYLWAPSLNAGDTFRIDYVAKPEPVFADYRTWRIPDEHCPAICLKAAALFMDTKKEMAGADYWHKTYELEIREARKRMGRMALAQNSYPTRL